MASEEDDQGCMGALSWPCPRSPKPKEEEIVTRGVCVNQDNKKAAAASSTSPPATVSAIRSNDGLKDALRKAKQENSKLLVLEFMAPWSEPCKFMRPVLEEIASGFKEHADFYTLDVEQFKTFARNTRVEALPTFLLVRKTILERVIGVSKDELRGSIEKHISVMITKDLVIH